MTRGECNRFRRRFRRDVCRGLLSFLFAATASADVRVDVTEDGVTCRILPAGERLSLLSRTLAGFPNPTGACEYVGRTDACALVDVETAGWCRSLGAEVPDKWVVTHPLHWPPEELQGFHPLSRFIARLLDLGLQPLMYVPRGWTIIDDWTQFPSAVNFFGNGRDSQCGGTLVQSIGIVTAAHCVAGQMSGSFALRCGGQPDAPRTTVALECRIHPLFVAECDSTAAPLTGKVLGSCPWDVAVCSALPEEPSLDQLCEGSLQFAQLAPQGSGQAEWLFGLNSPGKPALGPAAIQLGADYWVESECPSQSDHRKFAESSMLRTDRPKLALEPPSLLASDSGHAVYARSASAGGQRTVVGVNSRFVAKKGDWTSSHAVPLDCDDVRNWLRGP
jgi:hypothetical protein